MAEFSLPIQASKGNKGRGGGGGFMNALLLLQTFASSSPTNFRTSKKFSLQVFLLMEKRTLFLHIGPHLRIRLIQVYHVTTLESRKLRHDQLYFYVPAFTPRTTIFKLHLHLFFSRSVLLFLQVSQCTTCQTHVQSCFLSRRNTLLTKCEQCTVQYCTHAYACMPWQVHM